MIDVERAAGGLVVRGERGHTEVLLIDDAYGQVAFPKGHLEPGETWEDAAVREIVEETGIEARVLAPLGRVSYEIARAGRPVRKEVRLFLLRAIDESDEPVAQTEELKAAYYLPWAEAKAQSDERGYDNWKWVFAKAQVILQWHEENWEAVRRLAPDEDGGRFGEVWPELSAWLLQLMAATEAELAATAPALWERWQAVEAGDRARLQLPVEAGAKAQLQGAIEHTLLKPEASEVDVLNLCRTAAEHHFHAVCINPGHVRAASRVLADSGVAVCTVVGFPLGAEQTQALVAETEAVIGDGATEVDLVIPIGSMREDDIARVADQVEAVAKCAHAHPGVTVKAILETHFLSIGQVVKATMVAVASGADLVKTSTGFAPTGARLADVACMAVTAGAQHGVKAAGGVRTREAAMELLRFGATRIGTSSGPALVRQ